MPSLPIRFRKRYRARGHSCRPPKSRSKMRETCDRSSSASSHTRRDGAGIGVARLTEPVRRSLDDLATKQSEFPCYHFSVSSIALLAEAKGRPAEFPKDGVRCEVQQSA